MKHRLLLGFLLIFSGLLQAQDFSNKGKDFWVGYGYHIRMNQTGAQANTQEMVLYFTSDQNANVQVEIPALGYVKNYTVVANQVTETEPLPKFGAQDARLNSEGLSSKGIHITSDKAIVAYAHIYNASVSGASLLFPTNTLGQEYYSINFDQSSNEPNSNSWFYVVATEDNTTVRITPKAATIGGKQANVPFEVSLNKGQIYNVMAITTGTSGGDLTGSKIESISTGSSTCKRIAVFSGTGKINIGCTNGSADNLIQQAFPKNAWGKKYLTSPTSTQPNNYFRVAVSDPSAVVKRNGVVLNGLINNFYYQFLSNTPDVIESDKAIMVSQYSASQGCAGNFGGAAGDPEMIYLSPVEQTINRITLNSTNHFQINGHYINVVIKNGGVANFKLDGVSRAADFATHPRDAAYSYATFNVSAGSHTLIADTGFNAIAYGFGNAESYGYNAGTNVTDLYQYISIQNQYATVNFAATCKEAPFNFSITLPYQATSLTWDFNNNSNLTPNASVVNNSPIPDSTFIREGRTLYVYKLPGSYKFTATGAFPVKVLANNPSSDGCNGTQEINYDVTVYDKPVADWTVTHTGCLPNAAQFNDITNGFGRPTVKWDWDFGDNTTSTIKNPVKNYSGAGDYCVRLTSYTDIGCIADTCKSFKVTTVPNAKFGISLKRCASDTITFTDSSTITTGTIVKWYWDFGNGNTLVKNDNSPVTQIYSTAGNYTVTLKVESSSGCQSVVFSQQISIKPYPVADFAIPAVVCLPNGLAQFTDQSTISDGTQNQLTYLWTFSDGGTSTVQNATHTYSSIGPHSVQLSVTSNAGCKRDTTKQVNTIYPQPHADFTVMPEVCLRDTTLFTDVSIVNGGAVASWRWDFGDGVTDISQHPKHRYSTADTFTVKLFIYTDIGCVSDTMTKTTIVHPLPTPAFITTAITCETKPITFTDQSLANVGSVTNWHWNFGNGNITDLTNANPFNHIYAVAGGYPAKLAVTSSKGCKSDTLTKMINVRHQPVANFITPEVCLNDTYAQFLDSSHIANGSQNLFSYQWNFGDANATITNPNTSTVKDPLHKYTAVGPYTAWLKVTTNYGCTDSIAKDFFVNGSYPIASYEVDQSAPLCSNTKVKIRNKSTVFPGNITKVEIYWDYANNPTQKDIDDLPSFDKVYDHLYPDFQSPSTKTFQVRFVAYSGGTCTDDTTVAITVNASPKTQFVTIPGICFDAVSRQITQASETGGVAGNFLFSGNGINTTGLFNPETAGVGTHTLHYLFVSNAGCRDSADRSISVWPSPTAKFGVSSPVCEKNAVTFLDSSVANFSNIVNWNWNFGDGNTNSATNNSPVTNTYINAGTTPYNISLTVTTDSGCVSPALNKNILVNYLPRVNFGLPSVCLPDGLGTFTDSSTIPDGTASSFTYLWSFGDPLNLTPSTLKNPVHQYSALGPYAVKLVVTSAAGCIDSLSKQLTTVYPQPHADFSWNPTEVCLGAPFTFTGLSTGNGGVVNQWNWNFDDGSANATIRNPGKLYTKDSTYQVSLFIYNDKGCVSDTMTKAVTVHPYPTVNAGPDLLVLEGGYMILNPTVSGNDLTFKWTPNTAGYLDNDTSLNPRYTPGNDITYRLTVTGRGGCSVYDDIFITVLRKPLIPNVFSPNKDGINDTWLIQYLESYPGCTIEIFDRYGRRVFASTGYSTPWDGTVNGKDLPIGTYYYVIQPKNGRAPITGSVTILR